MTSRPEPKATRPRPKVRPTLDDVDREVLRQVVVEVVTNLNLPSLIGAALKGTVIQVARQSAPMVNEVGAPSTPTSPQEDSFSATRRLLDQASKALDQSRAQWYKAQEKVNKTGPFDPNFHAAAADLSYASHEYLRCAEHFKHVASGVSF